MRRRRCGETTHQILRAPGNLPFQPSATVNAIMTSNVMFSARSKTRSPAEQKLLLRHSGDKNASPMTVTRIATGTR